MNTTLPTGRIGVLLALAIAVGGLALVWLAVAAPLFEWHAERADRLDQQRALLRRMEALVRTLPELRYAASDETHQGTAGLAAVRLLDGPTDAVAAASLQQMVQDMAARVGVSLASAETLPATQAGAYRRIGLRVSVKARWSVLIGLLQAVAQGSPRMLVDDLQIHGPHFVDPPLDPPLDTGFIVFSFRAGVAPASGR